MPTKDKEKQAKWAREHYERNTEKIKIRAKEYRKRFSQEVREYVKEVKNVPCLDCGNKFIPFAMDFDHVEGIKEFSIGNAINEGVSLQKIQKEIAKCEIVCANCHRIRTFNRMAIGQVTGVHS